MVFNDAVMRERLPAKVYASLKKSIDEAKAIDPSIADAVADAMKEWATEHGATHYSHWFQPLSGVTAEKHESFITPVGGGAAIDKFSGHALVQGEADASSFPSGGLRATFEARGYTVWDPTSFAFIKDRTLCIPTAFCSYSGEALDEKTPLLRSMRALDKQARRILKLFGGDAKRVFPTTGAEQEYFLVDRNTYNKRIDLVYTGRTLLGARPPKGQELEDHYSGRLRLRVASYMHDLDEALWQLGVPAKTEHNEAAPAQHELACVFDTSNVACDDNHLVMEVMRRVAKEHGLTCLFHEKPFAAMNGSGKHLNWSLSTGDANLLDPGSTPEENAQFLTFFCAVIKAVDDYQDLLRLTVASSGNDHRLGAQEAPPAIVSVYIGSELDDILSSIEAGQHYAKKDAGFLGLGGGVLPSIPRDSTDRNRTSPFAFTGNRFEFRMPGAPLALAGACTVINTIVAEALAQFADELEGKKDFEKALGALIKRTIRDHRRIIFNGNGYGAAWVQEAKRRGLSNLTTAADAIPHLLDRKNVGVLTKHGIYTEAELTSRCEIMLDSYCKTVAIEAATMLEMVKRDVLPAVIEFSRRLAETITLKKAASEAALASTEKALLGDVSALTDELYKRMRVLERAADDAAAVENEEKRAQAYKENVVPAMEKLRETADRLETVTPSPLWPFPSYGTLLYMV